MSDTRAPFEATAGLTNCTWPIELCLRHRFAFHPFPDGTALYGAAFFAHLHNVKEETVRRWMSERGGRRRKFAEPMMTLAAFAEMFEEIHDEVEA